MPTPETDNPQPESTAVIATQGLVEEIQELDLNAFADAPSDDVESLVVEAPINIDEKLASKPELEAQGPPTLAKAAAKIITPIEARVRKLREKNPKIRAVNSRKRQITF